MEKYTIKARIYRGDTQENWDTLEYKGVLLRSEIKELQWHRATMNTDGIAYVLGAPYCDNYDEVRLMTAGEIAEKLQDKLQQAIYTIGKKIACASDKAEVTFEM